MKWLNDFSTTNEAWVYLITSFIGLYSNIYFTIKREKRLPNGKDMLELAGQLPLIWVVALLFNTSPWYSLIIGIVPDRIFDLLEKRGLEFTLNNLVKISNKEDKSTKQVDEGNKHE